MKNLIRIPLTLTLLFATCCLCLGQEFYRGELFVTGQHFSLTNGHLNVELSVDFEGLRMPSDESLTVTPVLKNGEYEQELPAVLINGAEKQKVYQRTQALAAGKRNSAKARTSPILLLRSQECACHGKKGDVYEDKIADGIRLPKMRVSRLDADIDAEFLSLVNFIQPAPDKDTLHCITGSIPYFKRKEGQKDGKQLGELSEEKQNFEIYCRLRDALHDVRQEMGTELAKISVTGYGVPVGNLKKNETNALIRALKLKEYLRENRLAGRTLLDVSWISEDWDSITSLVKKSDMLLKEATLDLINNIEIVKGRERMLMSFADGKPYKYLMEKIFPEVMRVDYRIEYTRKPLGAAESLQLLRSGKQRALHLNEFFAVAGSYPVGSTEYNDILDLAARLFPESPEANINAAAVALSKKELSKARGYLEPFATLPIAYNNMGILCLLEGNRDKAEVYLTMAAATGVEQAIKALEQLKIKD